MAALLRGLRTGWALRGIGSGMPMVTPQCTRVQRSFHQAAQLWLQDDSKSDQLTTATSNLSSPAHQQHFQTSEQDMSVSKQDVSESAPAHKQEASAFLPDQASVSASAPAPEQVVPESAPAPEQGVLESALAPVSVPEQEVSVSAPEQEACAPEQEVCATEQESSAPEQEACAPEQEASAPEQEVCATEQESSAPEQEASAPEQEACAPEQEACAPEQEAPEPNTSYADQGGEESEDYETEEQLQARILTVALDFVPQHGWSVEAISAGAQTLGLSSAAAGMFTNGARDLILHFIAQSNAQLTETLAKQHNQVQLGQAEPKETAEFLRYAVEARLRMVIPYIDTWPQAMSILLLPHNIPDSLKYLSTLIDDICYYAGDRSTDLKWYTRRVALTGVYNTTELVMLQDSSPDFQDTWTFLDKRIQDMINMANTAKQVQSTSEAVVQGIMGAAVTLKNLTGLNQRR
ncbi:hypothetical protein AAFF_G00287090 [Aldrovandia affinis]|uniref:Ubiquinone biosynthesis protein n=1 Tax=Aldrovandia affinis TaxID=143900 RepID=A0AAD7TAN2_9TELE|nr:hypothetical protein AAFF_G00287090 [Aldrovandia affinis]